MGLVVSCTSWPQCFQLNWTWCCGDWSNLEPLKTLGFNRVWICKCDFPELKLFEVSPGRKDWNNHQRLKTVSFVGICLHLCTLIPERRDITIKNWFKSRCPSTTFYLVLKFLRPLFSSSCFSTGKHSSTYPRVQNMMLWNITLGLAELLALAPVVVWRLGCLM